MDLIMADLIAIDNSLIEELNVDLSEVTCKKLVIVGMTQQSKLIIKELILSAQLMKMVQFSLL